MTLFCRIPISVLVCSLLMASFATASDLPAVSSGKLRLHLSADHGVRTSGKAVVRWSDQSENGNDFHQKKKTARPILVRDAGFYGQPVIRFDGEDDFLQLTEALGETRLDNRGPGEHFTLLIAAAGQSLEGLLTSATATTQKDDNGITLRSARFHRGEFRLADTTMGKAGLSLDHTGTILCISYEDTEKGLEVFQRTLASAVERADRGGNGGDIIWDDVTLGALSEDGPFFEGGVFEVVLYEGKLTKADRHAVVDAMSDALVAYALDRKKYLLLDARIIDEKINAHLEVGKVRKHPVNPLLTEKRPWETNTSHMYPSLIYDRDAKLFKLWYFSRIDAWGEHLEPGPLEPEEPPAAGGKDTALLYVTSKDGLHWERPKLDAYHYKGKPTNIVARPVHGAGVFKDPRAQNPARLFKLLSRNGGGLSVAFSPDGISWSGWTRVAETHADTLNNALWAPTLNKYVAITRGWAGDWNTRLVMQMESDDFVDWTEPVEVLRGSGQGRQTYAMPAFFYDGVYLGLTTYLLHDNRMPLELSWSPDTRTWHNVDPGNALIPLSSQKGAWDRACIFAADSPVIRDGRIHIFYSAQKRGHSWQPGVLYLATLEKDRWAGYTQEKGGQPAFVSTAGVKVRGDTLWLTADIDEGGAVTTRIFDKTGTLLGSKTLVSDVTETPLFDLSEHKQERLRLQFEIDRAKVFSFGFSD